MMNEGRAELQRVILQYEKQRAEAIRSKQEAEIVLPFVRAALEELDAALGQSEENAGQKREQTKRAVERSAAAAKEKAASRPSFEPTPARASSTQSVFGVAEDEVEDDYDQDDFDQDDFEDEAAEAKPALGRSSIASLIDQAGKDKQKTG